MEPGIYCAGWIKRGPTGVIGTNKKDATETVELLLEDAAAGRLEPKPDASAAAVDALLAERGVAVVEYAGWTAIDAAERTAGEKGGQAARQALLVGRAPGRSRARRGRRSRLVPLLGAVPGSPVADGPDVEPLVVECLQCGTTRLARRDRFKHFESPECPECGYLGWAPVLEVDGDRASHAA